VSPVARGGATKTRANTKKERSQNWDYGHVTASSGTDFGDLKANQKYSHKFEMVQERKWELKEHFQIERDEKN